MDHKLRCQRTCEQFAITKICQQSDNEPPTGGNGIYTADEAVTNLGHGTPDEILAEVRKTAGGVNASTIYRTLELLEELGLVTHAHLGHGAPTYHAAADSDHLHLVCRDCGSVLETDVAAAGSLLERLDADYGFETDVRHFAIFGRCRTCRDAARARREAAASG
jgi:Fur family transcriptional regulator, ferric uptake regulator